MIGFHKKSSYLIKMPFWNRIATLFWTKPTIASPAQIATHYADRVRSDTQNLWLTANFLCVRILTCKKETNIWKFSVE